MKKLLVLLGSIGLTSTVASAVVACGDKDIFVVIKTDLNTLNQDELIGGENMSSSQVLAMFLANNQAKFPNLEKSVEIVDFIAPSYTKDGKLEIKAKSDGNYKGQITIQITQLQQVKLDTLGLKTLLTNPVTNQEVAFDSFIKLNIDVNDLAANLEIISYTASDYDQTGSLVIQAKPNTKYLGTLTIMIPEQHRTNLEMLINNRIIQGTGTMSDVEAFQAFLAANKSWTNLNNFVDYSVYTPATYLRDGSLTIMAKPHTKFTGTITITISKLIQVDLSTLELNTAIGIAQDATQEDIFNMFLATNQDILGADLTLDQVELSDFSAPEMLEGGTLTITVKAGIDSKYTGTISIGMVYYIDETNLYSVVGYLSDNNLLNLDIPTSTSKSDLANVVADAFRSFMNGFQYGPNIKDIAISSYNQAPNQTQLDTKGYVWHSPSSMFIFVDVYFKDGTPAKEVRMYNLNVTITMV